MSKSKHPQRVAIQRGFGHDDVAELIHRQWQQLATSLLRHDGLVQEKQRSEHAAKRAGRKNALSGREA